MTGKQFVAFEYLEILRTEDLSSLQSQERDLMAGPLQASDRVVNMKLCGMRFIKADFAFLI